MIVANRQLSNWDISVLKALTELPTIDPVWWGSDERPPRGWITSVSVKEHLSANSLLTRRTLKALSAEGFVRSDVYSSVEVYSITDLGRSAVGVGPGRDISFDSVSWTGEVKLPQIRQVLAIVSEIEDICENLVDNQARYQIIGLVRSLEILLQLPNPPRQGIVELARDPAFSSFIQIAACLAAIVAALKA